MLNPLIIDCINDKFVFDGPMSMFSVTTPRVVINRYRPPQHAVETSALGGGLHGTVNNYIS